MACGCVTITQRTVLLASCVGVIYLAAMLVIVGLTTNFWIELRERSLYHEDVTVHFGLHRICWVSNDRCNNAGTDYEQQNSLPAVQGMIITGGFVSIVACMFALANFFLDLLGRSRGLFCAVGAVAAVIAGIFLMIGIILFAVKVEVRTEYLTVGYTDYLGYSFGLTTTASILMFIGAILSGVSGLSRAVPRFNYPQSGISQAGSRFSFPN